MIDNIDPRPSDVYTPYDIIICDEHLPLISRFPDSSSSLHLSGSPGVCTRYESKEDTAIHTEVYMYVRQHGNPRAKPEFVLILASTAAEPEFVRTPKIWLQKRVPAIPTQMEYNQVRIIIISSLITDNESKNVCLFITTPASPLCGDCCCFRSLFGCLDLTTLVHMIGTMGLRPQRKFLVWLDATEITSRKSYFFVGIMSLEHV